MTTVASTGLFDFTASAIPPCGNSLCFSTIEQMRIINVKEMQFTGQWFYKWTKVLVCRYKKEGKHQCLETTRSTQGHTIICKWILKVALEASYVLTHNRRRESLGHVIIITGISLNTQTASTYIWQRIFFLSGQSLPGNKSNLRPVSPSLLHGPASAAAAPDNEKVPSHLPVDVSASHNEVSEINEIATAATSR